MGRLDSFRCDYRRSTDSATSLERGREGLEASAELDGFTWFHCGFRGERTRD